MLEPSRILDFLGLHFNLEQAIVSPPDSFLDSLTSVLSHLSTSTVMSAHKISSITSRISHFASFIHHERLHLRFLHFWIKGHWSQHKQSWDTQIQLDVEFLTQLHWFNRQEVLQGVPLHLPEPNLFFFTDASLTGCGASWQNRHISGQWSHPDSSQHINWLELEAIRLAVLQWGPQWRNQTVQVCCDNSTAVAYIRKQGGTHSMSLFNKTLDIFHLLDQFVILLIPTHLPGARNVTADALSNQQPQSHRMEDSSGNLSQSDLCLSDPPSGHVRHGGEQGDSSLCFTLPGRQGLGGRCPIHILGRLSPSVLLPSSSHNARNPQEDQGLPRHHGDSHCFPALVLTVAPAATTTQPSSSHTADQRSTIPIHSQHSPPSVPQRASPVRSSHVALIRDILKQHNFPDTVVDMAADPLHDSSSNVYSSQWKAFAKWANDKGIQSKDLSYVTLAEYLVHLFTENKQVNTIKVHRASIASVLKMLNLPTALQEDNIHNIIRRMSILRPRTQKVLQRWHPSVVLKGLMKPPFAINGSDRNLSLELLSYKTVFLSLWLLGLEVLS